MLLWPCIGACRFWVQPCGNSIPHEKRASEVCRRGAWRCMTDQWTRVPDCTNDCSHSQCLYGGEVARRRPGMARPSFDQLWVHHFSKINNTIACRYDVFSMRWTGGRQLLSEAQADRSLIRATPSLGSAVVGRRPLHPQYSFTALRAVEGWKCRAGFRRYDVTETSRRLLRAPNGDCHIYRPWGLRRSAKRAF